MKYKTFSRIIMFSLTWLIVLAAGGLNASAQQAAPVTNLRASHTFGREIIFEADLDPEFTFTNAFLTFQTLDSNQSVILPAELKVLSILQAQFDLKNAGTLLELAQRSGVLARLRIERHQVLVDRFLQGIKCQPTPGVWERRRVLALCAVPAYQSLQCGGQFVA